MKASRKTSGLVHVLSGRRRRRKQSGASLRDGKTFALYRAACGLLASSDFDGISVSRLAKEGGCSVGAFYGRFPDKNTFLRFLIARTFHNASDQAAQELSDGAVRVLAFSQTVQKIVDHVSSRLSVAETAGIVRAAVKLGFADPHARKPFDDYRNAVTERALALLAPHIERGGEQAVREAMQIVFGSRTDAILVHGGGLFEGGALPTDQALCSAFTAITKGWVKPANPPVKTEPKEAPKSRPRVPRKFNAI